MKRICLLVCACLFCVWSAFAAKGTFSGRYNNRPIKEVLSDLKKETGTSVKTDKKAVNTRKTVTVNFHNATPEEVLNALFDCEYVIQPAKRKNTYMVEKRILKKAEKRVASNPQDTVPSLTEVVSTVILEDQGITLINRRQANIVHYADSVLITQERIDRPKRVEEKKDAKPQRQGSYIELHLGGAYSSMGYSLRDGQNIGHAGGNFDIQYGYFFTPEWGFSFGAEVGTYGSLAKLNTTKDWAGQKDSESEAYTHRVVTHDWAETQRTYIVSIPLNLQYQHLFNEKVGIFASIGGFVGMPILTQWQLTGGQIEHQGVYEPWKLVLSDVNSHDFYTEESSAFGTDKQSYELAKLAGGVRANIGAIFPLKPALDLFVGAYFNMVVNDLNAVEKTELGWRQDAQADYHKHAFMNSYNGLLQSDYASAVRPWNVGVKLGLHIHPARKEKKAPDVFDCFIVTDSTYEMRAHTETFYVPSVDTIQNLKKTLEKSVIWFATGDYQHPQLIPEDILNQVAEIMIASPEQHVVISGHASAEGNKRANQVLSERRAQTIADRLIELGVKAEQLQVSAHGSDVDYQGAEENNRSQAELNRRVEIIPQ